MKRDIRDTELYREAASIYQAMQQVGTGLINDATEIHASPNGQHAVFAGYIVNTLGGMPPTQICLTDLTTGDTRVLTFGPNVDRSPKFSPDGRQIAFLSDRHKAGDFQLYLLDLASGAARAAARVEGWAEYLDWSPDGKRILLGVAGDGADVSGAQGAITSAQVSEGLPSWIPSLETGDENYRWRRAWVYELATDKVRRIGPDDSNIWEAVWCGNDALAVVASPGAGEGFWYAARLHIIDLNCGDCREVYDPQYQLGCPAASPSGQHLAVVEAICSDRWIVAGELRLVDLASGKVERINTGGVDITHAQWRSDRHLLVAGHRGFETVVGRFDADSGTFTELWSSVEITCGFVFPAISGFNEMGDCVLVGVGFSRAPEIAVLRGGVYRPVKSFAPGCTNEIKADRIVERISWNAPDGLEIQGYLLRPTATPAPHPLIMIVHGGPVHHWRPTWLGGGGRSPYALMLLKRGYAIFLPNPRGSTGRGLAFARHVRGDMGGADTYDYLSGVDHLVKMGVADPARLGVTGGSYGGFMTSWLVCQDSRFAAAVSVAPITNQVTGRLIGNLPHFIDMFLDDSYTNAGGKYFTRSPVMHAHKVTTPTLNVCGALDRCTPPEEAVQFHNALLENGVKSSLVTYPEEGHGVRRYPALLDFSARVVSWFEEHMGGGIKLADDGGCESPATKS